MCISNKDKWCEKASLLLPAVSFKDPFVPLPRDGGPQTQKNAPALKAQLPTQPPHGTRGLLAQKLSLDTATKGLHGMKISNPH